MCRMSKLKCVLILLVFVSPVLAQKLTGRLGNPARPFTITAEIQHEGSFELQPSVDSLTNWLAVTNYNSLPATYTFSDSRTNKIAPYRLVSLNIPPAITTQPVGATSYAGQQVQLEGAA